MPCFFVALMVGLQKEARAALFAHAHVTGQEIVDVELSGAGIDGRRTTTFPELAKQSLTPGTYTLLLRVAGGDRLALEVPPCAGRAKISLDGLPIPSQRGPLSSGPVIVPLPPRPSEAHEVAIEVRVSGYERRLACGFIPRYGAKAEGREGFSVLFFASAAPSQGGGNAVLFVPSGHDLKKPAPLLVGLHPYNGSIWTYAAYAELLRGAQARGMVLLFPSGLGNSLYTAPAEDEVLRAIDALQKEMTIDPQRISLWGASMGGAGATTIGFHHPDRFAMVASFFGDSKYDLKTYVRTVLKDEAGAHLVNAFDVVDSARHLPVWLVHGEADRTSPLIQSSMLEQALKSRAFVVKFDRVPGAGHEGRLVAKNLDDLVARAEAARAPRFPSRISFTSARKEDAEVYGIKLVRASTTGGAGTSTGAATGGDAHLDIELREGAIHVLRASGLRAVELRPGALGLPPGPLPTVVFDDRNAKGLVIRREGDAPAADIDALKGTPATGR